MRATAVVMAIAMSAAGCSASTSSTETTSTSSTSTSTTTSTTTTTIPAEPPCVEFADMLWEARLDAIGFSLQPIELVSQWTDGDIDKDELIDELFALAVQQGATAAMIESVDPPNPELAGLAFRVITGFRGQAEAVEKMAAVFDTVFPDTAAFRAAFDDLSRAGDTIQSAKIAGCPEWKATVPGS